MNDSKPKLIAFYLPQYHPIPENDEWWGKGFTDWVNVKKGRPRFWNHYQPHIPTYLGYYDLRNEDIRIAQAELANQYGIYGFCYYHYWFNGKLLLDKPFNDVLASGKPDFPFCLCWANENWTRRWDGLENEILIGQDYSNYSPEKHIEWLSKAFADNRYIKINGKPLFLIYNASSINNLKDIIQRLRNKAVGLGFTGIYLCLVKSIHNSLNDIKAFESGCDSLVNFIPGNNYFYFRKFSSLPRYYLNVFLNRIVSFFRENANNVIPLTSVLSYKKLVESYIMNTKASTKVFPCVIPSWDNSARRKLSTVIQNDDSELYKKWLKHSIDSVIHNQPDERIVFINAWNEWAEGCHLEPDNRNGRKFLESTLQVLKIFC
jgi:lipopolysaccharide biosynthesis protein